ncbi:hypothetical protein O5O45_12140 [Hahella aquimaris]|uniref:hypothetical protein n=1 Tax=Hahella sp. HNIBRBA332 TaxID=3015983 RepID=UPI00273CD7FA|nr:hypothetical protein [Hahella sp. HNIBRBA332]WLQ16670.1 hypothetical protein O5O45_12140 [Hahella sp. HNIBRBA332]
MDSHIHRSPYSHLYGWIRFLQGEGNSQQEILKAFEMCSSVRLEPFDKGQIVLAKTIIRHALGETPILELARYCPPTRVLDLIAVVKCVEGYIFKAVTPEGEEDFLFWVTQSEVGGSFELCELPIKLLDLNKDIRELLLFKAHAGKRCRVEGFPYRPLVAILTSRDFGLPRPLSYNPDSYRDRWGRGGLSL